MDVFASTSEIVESTEEEEQEYEKAGDRLAVRVEKKHSIEDDINRLFQAIAVRNSGLSHDIGRDRLRKSAMKRPMRVGMSPSSGIGISEPVSLKQALRGLCISQASEMAAMKRMLKPAGSSSVSEAGNIKRLYRAVVVEANGSGLLMNQGKGNYVEISLVSDTLDFPEKIPESLLVPVQEEELLQIVAQSQTSELAPSGDNIIEVGGVSSTSTVLPINSPSSDYSQKDKSCSPVSLSSSDTGSKISKSFPSNPRFIFRSKNSVKNKVERKVDAELNQEREENERASPALSGTQVSVEATSGVVRKGDERSISREKGEFSQSSKSSIGEYSSCTSTSEESSMSGSSRSGKRPHMSRDLRWEAIHHIQKHHGSLGLHHFKLLRRLGCGDIGTVYLAELTGTNCFFALKVMDNEFLATRKKLLRAQTEREILQMLDHPFLPTLFAHFVSDKLSCLVMEYCPGGDLHVLRQKQPIRSFSEQAARFYVAEVLVALEYLHMLGVVYRDLKPENILVREDGHIMLSDFDLSLRGAAVNPTVVKSSSPILEPAKKTSSPCTDHSCIDPFCLQPSWQVSCFTPRLGPVDAKSRKVKSELAVQVSPLPQLVVEPTSARSNSFVGTHEYLAPEIIKGEGHGSPVDWWTFGIFLFELLYGRTPFKGSGNEDTLANVVSKSLKFPNSPIVSFHARDLIRGLLIKDPESRLGSVKGAAEIKQHPFFEGLNWALIRCAIPPGLPKSCEHGSSASTTSQKQESTKCKELEVASEHTEFEVF